MNGAGPNRHIDVAFSAANLLAIIRLQPFQRLSLIRCRFVLSILFSSFVVGISHGQELQWQGRLKDLRTVTGRITPGPATALQFQASSSKSNQLARPLRLQDLDLLELPNRSRTIPEIGMRQMVLANGDVLHVSLAAGESNKQVRMLHEGIRVSFAASEYLIPWNAVAQVGPGLGMRCLAECDFESDHPGWIGTTLPQDDQAIKTEPGGIKLSQINAASGRSSLNCSSDQPQISWRPTERTASGWLQFRFLTERTPVAQEPTVTEFQFQPVDSGPGGDENTPKSASVKSTIDPKQDANTQSVRVYFNAENGTIEASHSGGSNANHQILPCQPDWHLLTLSFTPQHRTIAIDGKLLFRVENQDQLRGGLAGLNFISGASSNPLWIDDFQAWAATGPQKAQRDQFDMDEVALRGGDKLFGDIQAISRNDIVLESQSMSARLDWREIEVVYPRLRPYEVLSLKGWHCQFALQPLWFDPGWPRADHLSGTLIEIGPTTATLQHCQLGKVVLSLQDLRQIQPLFQGIHLQLEGRPIHLGDEVDPTFQMPVPHGTKWNRSFHLDQVPAGRQTLKLTCRDLEPASLKSLRTQRWARLRNGEFVSEIRFNQTQPVILNHLVTGLGTELLPQSISVELPAGSLKSGHNELELVLKPSHDQSLEFDDWELLDLAIRIETDAQSP